MVRALAADAIGSIGPAARAAVQPLIVRLLATASKFTFCAASPPPWETSSRTPPALCQTCDRRKMHRVTYTAQEANLKIKKEPVPTWF